MVIPIGDRLPTRRRPLVTWALVAANLAVFAFVQPWAAGDCAQLAFFLREAAIPAELVQGHALAADQLAGTAAAVCGLSPQPEKAVYLSVVASMFLHGGWLHVLGNMLFLGIFGSTLEDRLGRLRFLAFYLASGVVATVVFVLANADSTRAIVGASGAVAAVLGAYIVRFPRARVAVVIPVLLFVVVELPALLVLGLWFLLQLRGLGEPELAGGGTVAYLAHVAGFVWGAGVSLIWPRTRTAPRRPRW